MGTQNIEAQAARWLHEACPHSAPPAYRGYTPGCGEDSMPCRMCLGELIAAHRKAEERAAWAEQETAEEGSFRFRVLQQERDALRERVREVQHAESKRHAELESRVAKYEYAFRRAQEWTERHDLKATWALDPSGPFWSMTSENARTALAELIAERDAARAELAAEQARSARLAEALRPFATMARGDQALPDAGRIIDLCYAARRALLDETERPS